METSKTIAELEKAKENANPELKKEIDAKIKALTNDKTIQK